MMQPGSVQKLRLLAAVFAVASFLTPHAADARAVARHPVLAAVAMHPHHASVGSLVRCTLLQQPRRSGRPEATRRTARFFAPTSQAVFFAHAGDRCIWHAGAPVRG